MKRNFYIIGLTFLSFNAFAGSFQLWSQGGGNVGDYAAGAAAIANDATTAYYNPAGLTRIKHQEMALSAIGQMTNVKYKGRASITPAITNFTATGTTQGGEASLIPTLLYAAPLNDKWAFGFNVTSPYYAYVNFSRNSFTRYSVVDATIKTISLGPSIAFKPIKQLSIGGGIDVQRFSLDYDRIDTTTTIAADSPVRTELSDWAFGWNTGLLWEFTPDTRIGFSYHSKVVHHSAGDSQFDGTGVTKSRAKAEVKLPALAILSAYHAFNKRWAVMGTATYTEWRTLSDLTLTNVAGTSATKITLQDPMKNSWRFSLGAHYTPTEKLLLRGALGYDQSPTSNSSRNILLPDANRYIIAFGIGYRLNKTIDIDLGYSHYFFQHHTINHTQTYNSLTINNQGRLQQSTDLLALQLNWRMT